MRFGEQHARRCRRIRGMVCGEWRHSAEVCRPSPEPCGSSRRVVSGLRRWWTLPHRAAKPIHQTPCPMRMPTVRTISPPASTRTDSSHMPTVRMHRIHDASLRDGYTTTKQRIMHQADRLDVVCVEAGRPAGRRPTTDRPPSTYRRSLTDYRPSPPGRPVTARCGGRWRRSSRRWFPARRPPPARSRRPIRRSGTASQAPRARAL